MAMLMMMMVEVMMMIIIRIHIVRAKQCRSNIPALNSKADVGAASVSKERALGPLAFTDYHPTTNTTITMMNV